MPFNFLYIPCPIISYRLYRKTYESFSKRYDDDTATTVTTTTTAVYNWVWERINENFFEMFCKYHSTYVRTYIHTYIRMYARMYENREKKYLKIGTTDSREKKRTRKKTTLRSMKHADFNDWTFLLFSPLPSTLPRNFHQIPSKHPSFIENISRTINERERERERGQRNFLVDVRKEKKENVPIVENKSLQMFYFVNTAFYEEKKIV